jgi:hypothetical protein
MSGEVWKGICKYDCMLSCQVNARIRIRLRVCKEVKGRAWWKVSNVTLRTGAAVLMGAVFAGAVKLHY